MGMVLNLYTTGGYVGAMLLMAGGVLGVLTSRLRAPLARPVRWAVMSVVWALILSGGVVTLISR
jgi:hypothetical protein